MCVSSSVSSHFPIPRIDPKPEDIESIRRRIDAFLKRYRYLGKRSEMRSMEDRYLVEGWDSMGWEDFRAAPQEEVSRSACSRARSRADPGAQTRPLDSFRIVAGSSRGRDDSIAFVSRGSLSKASIQRFEERGAGRSSVEMQVYVRRKVTERSTR